MRASDCANVESLFRIIQSIPSSKAELFKRWLAKVGYERVQEIEDPELAFDNYRSKREKLNMPFAALKLEWDGYWKELGYALIKVGKKRLS